MIRSLQACRCLAVLLVVVHHTSNGIFVLPKYFNCKPLGHLFYFGEAGVDFFLVLSGFIITYVHRRDVGRPDRLRVYAWKRLTRIYPTYWAALVPLVLVFFLVPQFGLGHERDVDSILCSMLLLPHPHHAPILGVAWTLR